MSGQTLKKIIEKEIVELNNNIDLKIIKGVSYIKESRRHKFLLRQLRSLSPYSNNGWFKKSFSLISSFIL